MDRVPIAGLSYARLSAADPAAAAAYATGVLGLARSGAQAQGAALRSDERYQTLAFLPAGEEPSIGVELADAAALDAAARALAASGRPWREATAAECRARLVRRCLITRDASGNGIDLVLRPAYSGRRFFPGRDAGVRGLHSLGLRSTALDADLDFWTGMLDAEISDWVGDISYLRIDGAHHRIALYPSTKKGLLYLTHEVESLDAIMQSYYLLQDRKIDILHGPGQEAASGQVFLRFAGPDGQVYCYGHGMDQGLSRRPRQYPLEEDSICAWGSVCTGIPELQTEGGSGR